MNLYKIFLFSENNNSAKELKEVLEKNRLYDVHLVDPNLLTFGKVPYAGIHLGLFDMEIFNRHKMRMLTDSREMGYEFPMLALARWMAPDAVAMVEKTSKTILLEKPYEQKDLWGLVKKLTQGNAAKQRYHRRFFTNQSTSMEMIQNGSKVTGSIFNLSRGGAYVEYEQSSLKVGDMMRFHVDLKDMKKAYSVNAKVVWISPKSDQPGRFGAGIEFMKAGDVYRNLLSKI